MNTIFIKKNILNYLWLLASIFIFCYLIYRSEFSWNGERRNYYFNYLIINFFLILLSIALFFFNTKINQYINIIFLSVIFSLYFFEYYLIVKKNNFKKSSIEIKAKILKEKTGETYDTRSKVEIYDDLKANNNNISVTVGPQQFSLGKKFFFLLSGVSKSKTINCNENGYYSMYESDRYGFNNPDLEWENNPELLIIGDSFSFGSCVHNKESIAFLLRKFTKKSVINLGYPGLGPLTQYASLREYFPKRTKKIIWFFYEGNDLLDLKRELKNKILMNYFNDINFSQNLKMEQILFDDLYKKKVQEEFEKLKNLKNIEKNQYSFNNILNFIKLNNLRSLFIKEELPTKKFVEIVKKVKFFSDKNNAELYFVYLPEYKRFKNSYDNTNYQFINKKINEFGINFIDINKNVFVEEKNPLSLFPFENKGHYNAEGYSKTFEEIYKIIKD